MSASHPKRDLDEKSYRLNTRPQRVRWAVALASSPPLDGRCSALLSVAFSEKNAPAASAVSGRTLGAGTTGPASMGVCPQRYDGQAASRSVAAPRRRPKWASFAWPLARRSRTIAGQPRSSGSSTHAPAVARCFDSSGVGPRSPAGDEVCLLLPILRSQMGRWQSALKPIDGGVLAVPIHPSVTPCGRATSPFVLRKNREELTHHSRNAVSPSLVIGVNR